MKDLQETIEKLKIFSVEMEQGSIEALYEVKKIVENWRDLHFEAARLSYPDLLVCVWFLREFLIRNLWYNFGGDSRGFPKKEGLPYLDKIIKGLGAFIHCFLEDNRENMHYLIFNISFIEIIEAYYNLVSICDRAHSESGERCTL